MEEPVIKVESVSFSFGFALVLDKVNLDIRRGEFLGIVGPNAGGKSTLLKIILGLLEPLSGRVRVLGKSPSTGRKRVGYVPQYPAFPRDFPITVEQTVLMGRLGRTRMLFGFRAVDHAVACRTMEEAEIRDLAERRLNTLSGGQLQRVLVARALACEPEILILDEPTANIDMRVETEIFDLLKELNERMTILVVSHDVAFISRYVNRVACLNRTLMCHETSAIDGGIIERLYGNPVQMVQHTH